MSFRSGQRIFVTGATGFVGGNLCATLLSRGFRVRRGIRAGHALRADDVAIAPDGDWCAALDGVECIVHLAARTHATGEHSPDLLAEYRRTNVDLTTSLASAAVRAGVRRFVFMSSIKVNGERTTALPFREADPPHPEDAYGTTKLEAERALLETAQAMEVVILRAPLVYGPGVQGNFLQLMRWVASGWPLPLASIQNSRSLIFVANLVDAMIAGIRSPGAAGKTYLVRDGEDVSTPALIRALAKCLGVPARLFPFPVSMLKIGATILGAREKFDRIAGSLRVDDSAIRYELGWQPPFTLAQGLEATARDYQNRTTELR